MTRPTPEQIAASEAEEREAEAFVDAQWKAADAYLAAEWPHATDGERAVARSLWTELARRALDEPQLPATVPLNDDTRRIFGMMCFQAAAFASCFRMAGVEIPTKAEAEQAYVIHWMLNLYLLHGAKWRDAAYTDLDEAKAKAEAAKAAQGATA